MLEKKIRPIPKYILRKIQRADRRDHNHGTGVVRFYGYLTKNDGELVNVIVAVKNKRTKWYCKQVIVHGIHSDRCFLKDILFNRMSGYAVGWYDEGLQTYRKWFESDEWGWNDDRYFNPCAPIVNREYLAKFPEYKYSGVELYDGYDVFRFLRTFEEYPQVEYLMKAGLQSLVYSRQILRKVAQEKPFRKWLMANRVELASEYHYVSVILRAYRTGKPLKYLQTYHSWKLSMEHDRSFRPLKETFKNDLEKFYTYLMAQQTTPHTYLDYLEACQYVGLNMSKEKNRYPHDFKRWHDVRIDEYRTARAMKDEQQKKELFDRFAAVADKYGRLQKNKDGYTILLAHSPTDLVREGEALHHCVGSMGYDRKMAREEILIFFVRPESDPDTPFVTMEYSLASGRILQCHGSHNARPDDKVMRFIEKTWLPHAQREQRKIQRSA